MQTITEKAKLGVRYVSDLLALRNKDVLLSSFPRSGNTWTRFMCCHLFSLLQGHDADEVDFPFLDEKMPAIGAGNVSNEWRYAPYPRIVKTHARWLPFFKEKRSIGLVRDPRDVMVSYYHYQKDRNQIFEGSFSSFIRHPRYGLRQWLNHYSSWRSHWNITIRFESMKKNTLGALKRIARYLQIECSETALRRAIKHSSINRVRKADNARRDKIGQKNEQFARQGEAKQWKSYFSDEDIKFYFQIVKDKNLPKEYLAVH